MPLNIAIIGYGKMGREVEKLALDRGHHIAVIIDNEKDWQGKVRLLKQADVAIEFTAPGLAAENIKKCFAAGIPVVCGTTGWYEHLPGIAHACHANGHALFYAPNFSIGVNIFFELNSCLSRLMAPLRQYKASISETHHVHKADKPSGTAIRLASDIIEQRPDIRSWGLAGEHANEEELPIEAVRSDQVPGTHKVIYVSDNDTIDIQHTAHNRQGFAEGALMAASWLPGKKGVFTMKDLLKL